MEITEKHTQKERRVVLKPARYKEQDGENVLLPPLVRTDTIESITYCVETNQMGVVEIHEFLNKEDAKRFISEAR